MGLTTVESVRTQGGSGTDEYSDEQIQIMIDGISDLVKKALNRDLELKERTEYYSGNNNAVLILNQRPVISVSRVCVDGGSYFGQSPNAFPVTSDLVPGVDYVVMAGVNGVGSSGCLRRLGGFWPNPPIRFPGRVSVQPGWPNGNILVTYTAGLDPIPAGIVFAVNQAVLKACANAMLAGEAQSKSYEDASISYVSQADLQSVFGSIDRVIGSYKTFVV